MDRRHVRVPVGAGVLHCARATYSPETHQLLRVLMAESRLTMLQRKQLGDSLREGRSLPAQPPTAHAPASLPRAPVDGPPAGAFRLGCRRLQDAIVSSGAYERERFVPAHPRIDKEKEKRSFQDKMSFGKEMPPSPRSKKGKVWRSSSQETGPDIDRFDELVHEVNERVQFLKDMEALGQGHKYYPIIQQEIAAKVREMERIDKERCRELENN
ncbi:UPF0193 protein EVG1 [Frankliniella fusca]|uniref:UPF0193 protein EVG1 n=1 Tax=Frankliniella fusca TaxID=407009 RepID=A0AAE1GSH6_9NEOP|nr:UPF0193 protein EVG1 [Frankliniella fusca]